MVLHKIQKHLGILHLSQTVHCVGCSCRIVRCRLEVTTFDKESD